MSRYHVIIAFFLMLCWCCCLAPSLDESLLLMRHNLMLIQWVPITLLHHVDHMRASLIVVENLKPLLMPITQSYSETYSLWTFCRWCSCFVLFRSVLCVFQNIFLLYEHAVFLDRHLIYYYFFLREPICWCRIAHT